MMADIRKIGNTSYIVLPIDFFEALTNKIYDVYKKTTKGKEKLIEVVSTIVRFSYKHRNRTSFIFCEILVTKEALNWFKKEYDLPF